MPKGSVSSPRYEALKEASSRSPRRFQIPEGDSDQALKVSDYFGINTFGARQMKEKLPKDVFKKLVLTIERGKKLDGEIADSVAQAVKEWASARGVTHFCHWFHPQTGATAEKHDAFLSLDDHNNPIEKFSGAQLIQSEPDASSFPSGGVRTTFEARGYTAWDPSSPMFIMESTNGKALCIPSAFVSYSGHALDKKTGLMRSVEALSKNACELLEVIGEKGVNRVVATLGPEQEYFLVDRAFYTLRPDLIMSGRTLLGSRSAKGQQLEDHYFGSIPSRAHAAMSEMEYELYKLGVPIKTRHNEVAPSQFEMAPIFEEVNVATDHNQLVMAVIKKVARRHGFQALLHEKPFAELNGSGKHLNWSLMITASGESLDGTNLLDPGKTPYQNLRFLLFLVGVLKGVHRHAGLLRAGIASPGNDHRLGANEAPPAIISAFLGDTLSEILDKIESGDEFDKNSEEAVLKLGVGRLPEVAKDNTDRNRTSPFAFTGNKFEFRAVGSSDSPALPITFLNAAVAQALSELTVSLKSKLKSKSVDAAILELLKEVITETKSVRFEGNNYSEEWVKEAESRGLLNIRKTPEALEQMIEPKSMKLFKDLKIFTEGEITSRFNVKVDRYVKQVAIEVETLKSMIDTQVLPAAFRYHGELVSQLSTAKSVGRMVPQTSILDEVEKSIRGLQEQRALMGKELEAAQAHPEEIDQAKAFSKKVLVLAEKARTFCDQLEDQIPDDLWPLPKYREMLFLS